MKIVIVKESGKIKIGKKEITSPSLVKGLLKCKDLKDRARQNERTYWLRITFEETVQIIMGDFKVSKEPEHEAKIVGEVNYQVRTFKDEKIRLFIAKPDSQFKSIRTKTLKYGEEWVVMFTEIENSQTDRREIIRGLIKMMREELQRYQLDVAGLCQ